MMLLGVSSGGKEHLDLEALFLQKCKLHFWVWGFLCFPPGGKLHWSYNMDIKYSVALMNKTHKIGMNAKYVFISQDIFYYRNLG